MSRKKISFIVMSAAFTSLLLVLLPVTGVVKLFKIPSSSMSPTVQSGDTIFATKIFNPAKTVKRGDVVAYDGRLAALKDRHEMYLSRVVATGGDTVEVVNGDLCVNGVALPERNGLRCREVLKDRRFLQPVYPLKVPADSVFVIGDQYDNSLDSRYLGTIPLRAITHSAKRIMGPAGHVGKIE